jgi:cytochrome bd-type quinol oxidase subunit 2
MLGAGLGFVAPWNAVPTIFVVLTQTLAGISAFALARRMISERAARFGAFCYAANPYALLIVYLRSDFAELLALSFFPLLFLMAFELSGALERRRRTLQRGVALFGIFCAAVWLSNAPAGVLASYSLALVFTWAAGRERSWRPLARGGAGLALGFGLAAVYIVPAAYEQRWVNIAQALSTGLLPQENFLFTQTNDPEHTFFNWVASGTAVLMIVLTGLAALAAWRENEGEAKDSERRKYYQALLLLSAGSTLLMLRFTAIFWDVLPKLRFVQFPWRWMSILAVAFAVFLGAAVERRRHVWVWVTLVVAIFAGTGALQAKHGWWDGEDLAAAQAAVEQKEGFDGTDEYDPAGDDHTDLPVKASMVAVVNGADHKAPARNAKIRVEQWTPEEKKIRVDTKEPARIALRLLDYPAWRVEVNDKPVLVEHPNGTEQMIVALATGESEIVARFTRTWDRTFGGAISVLGVLAFLTLFGAGGRPLRSAGP